MKHILHIHDRHMRLIQTHEISKKAYDSLKANPARISIDRQEEPKWPNLPERQWSVVLVEIGKPFRLAKGPSDRTAWGRRNARFIASKYKNHPRITAKITRAKP